MHAHSPAFFSPANKIALYGQLIPPLQCQCDLAHVQTFSDTEINVANERIDELTGNV